jgi:hypothetical protein
MSRELRSSTLADWLFRLVLVALALIWFITPPLGQQVRPQTDLSVQSRLP